MAKYGYSSITNEHIYHEYCECCGNFLGSIHIIYDGKRIKERDDLLGWKFCPYCGESLYDEEP